MTKPKGPDDLLSPEALLQMSGLEFMQGVLSGELAEAAISETLTYGIHAVEDGRVVFRGAPEFSSTNPMGGVHGG